MNKKELVEEIAKKSGITKVNARKMLDNTFDIIAEQLAAGEKIQLSGFGTFKVRSRAARKSKNPRTGKIVDITEASVPSFRAGKPLKNTMNKK